MYVVLLGSSMNKMWFMRISNVLSQHIFDDFTHLRWARVVTRNYYIPRLVTWYGLRYEGQHGVLQITTIESYHIWDSLYSKVLFSCNPALEIS